MASTALVAVAVITSLHALTVLIGPGQWTRTGTIFVLGLALVTGSVRLLVGARHSRPPVRARALLPTVAGILVGCWGLLAAFGGVTSRGVDLAISSASLDRLLARFTAANSSSLPRRHRSTRRSPRADRRRRHGAGLPRDGPDRERSSSARSRRTSSPCPLGSPLVIEGSIPPPSSSSRSRRSCCSQPWTTRTATFGALRPRPLRAAAARAVRAGPRSPPP
ncbi:hypothetical protein NKG05_00370 [Oerskovia sp. M15]